MGLQVIKRETFAPILYVVKFKDLDEAIAINNEVYGSPQFRTLSMYMLGPGRAGSLFFSIHSAYRQCLQVDWTQGI